MSYIGVHEYNAGVQVGMLPVDRMDVRQNVQRCTRSCYSIEYALVERIG